MIAISEHNSARHRSVYRGFRVKKINRVAMALHLHGRRHPVRPCAATQASPEARISLTIAKICYSAAKSALGRQFTTASACVETLSGDQDPEPTLLGAVPLCIRYSAGGTQR
jgi:hypothetical protein